MPVIRESWGLEEDETPQQFADMVYGVKFHFATGGPGYVGDIYPAWRRFGGAVCSYQGERQVDPGELSQHSRLSESEPS